MMAIDLDSVAILNIHGFDYWCIINIISKSEAANLFKNSDLNEKSGTL